jgi:predicted TIM-barrel fold metal-dependent hydrolase
LVHRQKEVTSVAITTGSTPDFLIDPEPRDATYTIISTDDHVVEAPDTFKGRLPRHLADRAPRIIELDAGIEVSRAHQALPNVVTKKGGRQVWEYEGKIFAQVGLNAVVGHTDYAAQRFEPTSFEEMRPGCFDADARVRDMDIAGVWSSVNFPSSIAGFCGSVFSSSNDPELGYAVMQAWNDWIQEMWCSRHPDRFIGLGLTWLADPERGADEVRRNAERGFRAVTMPELPHWLGYPEIHTGYWDPVLIACAETDTAICLHVGSSGMLPLPPTGPRFEKNITLFPAASLLAATEWLWSGIFHRFPTLKVVMSEGGIGWVPMLLDRLDYIMSHSGAGGSLAWEGDLSPSETLLTNFWFCMLDDPSTLPILDRIGSDRVMVEVDYPHSDTTWPDCQSLLHERFSGGRLSDAAVADLTYRTAAELFRAPLPPGVS